MKVKFICRECETYKHENFEGRFGIREAIEKDLISKEESIETVANMIKDGFRISTRIYAKFLEDLK